MIKETVSGKIVLTPHGWHFYPANVALTTLPIYDKDIELAEKINALNRNHEVEALMVDEFTYPELFSDRGWGRGTWCYKITNAENLLK